MATTRGRRPVQLHSLRRRYGLLLNPAAQRSVRVVRAVTVSLTLPVRCIYVCALTVNYAYELGRRPSG